MARPLWKGVISFGLVTIPVELHTAVRGHRARFRLLHAKDKSPVRYDRVCQREGKPVAWEELVKGFEYEKGKFVVLTKDDFESAALEQSKSIDIGDFVKPEQVDDRFFETAYYVVPGKGGERGYALLREAIRESKRIGIGTFVLREAQHVAALTVVEQILVLTLMRYADELVDASDYPVPDSKAVHAKELQLARMLVENLAGDWHPEKYKDEYQSNLKRVIADKLKGRAPEAVVEAEPQPTAVVDLMDRLRQSLEQRKSGAAAPRRAARKKKSRARRAA
jgi:DNA end-binding protein Ku